MIDIDKLETEARAALDKTHDLALYNYFTETAKPEVMLEIANELRRLRDDLEHAVGELWALRSLVRWLARQPCIYGIRNDPCRLNSGDDPNEYCLPHACQEYLETGEWPANFEAHLRVGADAD